MFPYPAAAGGQAGSPARGAVGGDWVAAEEAAAREEAPAAARAAPEASAEAGEAVGPAASEVG